MEMAWPQARALAQSSQRRHLADMVRHACAVRVADAHKKDFERWVKDTLKDALDEGRA